MLTSHTSFKEQRDKAGVKDCPLADVQILVSHTLNIFCRQIKCHKPFSVYSVRDPDPQRGEW